MAEARILRMSDLRGIIQEADELAKGTQVFDSGALSHLARCGERLYAEARGSGASPYRVSALVSDAVTARCSCPAARTRPFCKHGAALIVAWARSPQAFAVSDAPPPGAAPDAAPSRKSVKQGKTTAPELMRQGVQRVSTLIVELAVSGVASSSSERAAQVRALGESLREQRLRRISARTIQLANLLDVASGGRQPLEESEYSDLLADMLLTVRKLEKHLAGEALEERHVEELIGRTWQKKDRRPVEGLALVEILCTTRLTPDGFLIQEGRFVDVFTGVHYSEKHIIPRAIAARTPPRQSHAGSCLEGARGSIYPGFAPFRLDLDEGATAVPVSPSHLQGILDRALPDVGSALRALQEHRKDVFAPPTFPVSVKVEALVAEGHRLQAVDAEDHALFLGGDQALGDSLALALRGVRLRALLGEVGLDGGVPVLHPHAAIVDGDLGLALVSLGIPAEALADGGASVAARAAGSAGAHGSSRSAGVRCASAAATALAEVRHEMAGALATGLAGLVPRITDPLASRLRDLKLEKQAALLDALVQRPDPAERVDDFIKLYQVLAIAQVRLAGTSHHDAACYEPVPTFESVRARRPETWLTLAEVQQGVADGSLGRYEAALHRARAYASMPVERLLSDLYPTWADGSATPFLAQALAGGGERAVEVATQATAPVHTLVTRLTGIAVLRAVGGNGARDRLHELVRDSEAVVRTRSIQALLALGEGSATDPSIRGWDAVVRAGGAALSAARGWIDGTGSPAWCRTMLDQGAEFCRAAVRRLFSARSRDERADSATRIASAGGVDFIPALRAALVLDPSVEVRQAVCVALARLGDTDSVDSLASVVARAAADAPGAPSHDEGKYAACALAILGDIRGLRALVAAAGHGWKPAVVQWALRGDTPRTPLPLIVCLEENPDAARPRTLVTVLGEAGAALGHILVDRLERTQPGTGFVERAALYLKLAAGQEDAHRLVAGLIVPRLTALALDDKPSRALMKAAQKVIAQAP